MSKQRITNVAPDSGKSASRRLLEIVSGLIVIAVAVIASKFWIEAGNSERADSVAFRRSVQMTLEEAAKYGISGTEEELAELVERKWSRFLAAPSRAHLSPRPAHAFVDSFVLKYRDGVLDSTETSKLYHQLATFGPEMD